MILFAAEELFALFNDLRAEAIFPVYVFQYLQEDCQEKRIN